MGWAAIVANGGFEVPSGPLASPVTPTAWTVGGSGDAGADSTFPHGGLNDAFLGDGTLSQALSLTPGQSYTVTFWLGIDDSTTLADTGASFTASLGRTSLTASPIASASFGTVSEYLEFTDTAVAASSVETLGFDGFTTGDAGDWYLDDVSVVPTASTSTPEPSALAMLCGALGLLSLIRLRARRA